MHSTHIKTIIGTEESVYRDSSAGKLEGSSLVRTMLVPHSQRFYSNGEARLSVAVHDLPAFAFEQGIVVTMPAFSHSTAAATPFRGVVGINNVERDSFVEASCFEVLPEQVEGDSHDFSVEFLGFGVESFEVLNGDVGIVFECEVGEVSDDFAYAVLDEVLLSDIEFSEFLPCRMASFVGGALKDLSPLEDSLTPCPDVFAVVELLQDLSFGREDGCGEAFTVHIHAEDILSFRDSLFFGEEGNYLSIHRESVCLTTPSRSNEVAVSLIVPVPEYRDGDGFAGVWREFHKEPGLGLEGFAVPRRVEFDGDGFDLYSSGSDDASYDFTNYLASEGGVFLG
jgi:hypothetical protein